MTAIYKHTPVYNSGPTKPFIYLWFDTGTWIEEHQCHKRYLGISNGKKGFAYVGSGSAFQAAYSERPNDFQRLILRHDADVEILKVEETLFLQKVQADANTAWYNISLNTPYQSGFKLSTETRVKISLKKKGIPRTEEAKEKIKQSWIKRKEQPIKKKSCPCCNRDLKPNNFSKHYNVCRLKTDLIY